MVSGNGPSLFGRNWLEEIRLDWGNIRKVTTPLEQLLQEYEEVFRKELGTVKDVEAKLEILPEASPRFHKPRSVPYAIKQTIEKDLEKVKFSDWAAPIVPGPLCVLMVTYLRELGSNATCWLLDRNPTLKTSLHLPWQQTDLFRHWHWELVDL